MKRMILVLVAALALMLVAAASLAQERDPRDRTIAVDEVSFTMHRALFRTAVVSEYPGDSPEFGPGFSDAPHVQVALSGDAPAQGSLWEAPVGIRVYRIEDLADFPFLTEQADALAALLAERPDLTAFQTVEAVESNRQLPFIPVLPHGQLIRARVQYVETDDVAGIAYITYSNAAREPFLSNQFSYTFQGLSADGAYYVSASMRLETGLFPSEVTNFDPVAFEREWPAYLAESVAALNGASPEDFEPALGVLDGLVQTFAFGD